MFAWSLFAFLDVANNGEVNENILESRLFIPFQSPPIKVYKVGISTYVHESCVPGLAILYSAAASVLQVHPPPLSPHPLFALCSWSSARRGRGYNLHESTI